jgi:predicted ATP-grasp superfamily ATP-dependent carboligase
VLGFSEQWTAPSARSLWRYGGAIRPASLPAPLARMMTSAVKSVVTEFKLKGLGSADFLVNGEDALLLEINPRPGATIDIFDSGRSPLIQLHLDAVHGRQTSSPAPQIFRCEGLRHRLCDGLHCRPASL